MPNYDFSCTACGNLIVDVLLPIADRDRPLSEPCPACGETALERCVAAPGVSYSINRGGLKTPQGFKDILKDIKSKHPRSTINVDG